jgi:glucose-6-phosphate dehydrogenase assembly protein OpcA
MPAVSDNVWAEQDTTPGAIEAALRRLLAERHAESEAYVPARVLNLVCIVDREWSGEIANRLRNVGRYHASRTIVCQVSHGRTTLDATASVSARSAPEDGAVALTVETVIVDMGPQHLDHLDTIVDPLVVTDLATVVWAPHGHWEAVDALGGMSQIVLLDSVEEFDVAAALLRSRRLLEERYVVDLAWLRSAPWRERIAAAFDPPARRAQLGAIKSISVRHHPASGAAALLWCGWLASRLGWELQPLKFHVDGCAEGMIGETRVDLEAVNLQTPGLQSVMVETGDGASLELSRGRGGLQAAQRDPDGEQRRWTVLGASRGEGGILGEGIRQSLLRDPVYAQALYAAAALLPPSS